MDRLYRRIDKVMCLASQQASIWAWIIYEDLTSSLVAICLASETTDIH